MVTEVLSSLKGWDDKCILAYANANMRLTSAAESIGVHYRTMASRLDFIYKRTKLDPRNFYDLIQLVEAVNTKDDGHS